eukprot:3081917-Amphidinium_carterae.1
MDTASASKSSADELHSDFDQATNYSGFDADEETQNVIRSYHEKGYLEEFFEPDQTERILGFRLVISRFGIITKVEDGKIKKRIILDAKAFGITSVTRSAYGVRLRVPRTW